MYFPSPLPTTRLSISTSALPIGPSTPPRPTSLKPSSSRNSKGKFKESLGGVLEEEGEEVVSIVCGFEPGIYEEGSGIWAVLGREEVSIWSIRVSLYPLLLTIDKANHLICIRSLK